jgi:formylglycine-generating enzyme required for sulfatase activity
MDHSEVTVSDYTACVADGACTAPEPDAGCNYTVSGRELHPVNCVNWQDASDYCAWMGKRLPTEWEWEWAARGRTEARTYPWGSAAPTCQLAVMYEGGGGCGQDTTWQVGSKSPAGDSLDGIRDMAGNVWEWTGSWYEPEEQSRVLRGGSWLDEASLSFETSYRISEDPGIPDMLFGFRCVGTP